MKVEGCGLEQSRRPLLAIQNPSLDVSGRDPSPVLRVVTSLEPGREDRVKLKCVKNRGDRA